MEKTQLTNKDDIFNLIVNCYQTDSDFINKYHEVSGSGLSSCIDRTVNDFYNHDVKIFSLETKGEFVGYFGQLQDWLTGFFIIPEKRTEEIKQAFWSEIVNNFNGYFNVGILSKNTPAKRFLMNNGCKFQKFELSPDGLGEIMIYSNKGDE